MKTYEEMEVQRHSFLTSELDLGQWSVSRPDRFITEERAVVTDWVRCWVGPRVALEWESVSYFYGAGPLAHSVSPYGDYRPANVELPV